MNDAMIFYGLSSVETRINFVTCAKKSSSYSFNHFTAGPQRVGCIPLMEVKQLENEAEVRLVPTARMYGGLLPITCTSS
jgi:hypothetical protein